MTEDPVKYAHEARNNHAILKELLKAKDPYDRELDFQRKNLRRQYLALLLLYPYAKEAKDADTHLWMQTSYAIIASYKDRLSALDRALQQNQQQKLQLQQDGQPHPPKHSSHHGPVEHRKLLQRFRQFLAEEEKFWSQLIVRMCRSFALDEARPALKAAGILTNLDDPLVSPVEGPDAMTITGPPAAASNPPNPPGNTYNPPASSRNLQFPPEDDLPSVVPTTPAERDHCLARVTKVLICLGDIARYRELYNDSRGKPRAGQNDNIPAKKKRGRGTPGGLDTVARPRNYERARTCYQQAKLLLPGDGNPSHQLAILASYERNHFVSLYHHYRALCVRQPYEPALENMNVMLSKTLDQWRTKMKNERDKMGPVKDLQPGVWRINAFQEKLVALHALWRVGLEKGFEKMEALSPKHRQVVHDDFLVLLSERHLSMELILDTVVMAQSALWKYRMFQSSSGVRKVASITPGNATVIEAQIFLHILDIHRALMEVGVQELSEPIPEDAGTDLAQRITATFRRTLEALRVSSKWLRANGKYMHQDPEFLAFQERQSRNGRQVSKDSTQIPDPHSLDTIRFWKTFLRFMNILSEIFPENQLPQLSALLEEDVDLRGFRPLRNVIDIVKEGDYPELHPNDEQLMRIWDLLEDVKILAGEAEFPLGRSNNAYILSGLAESQSPIEESKEVIPPKEPRTEPRHRKRHGRAAREREAKERDVLAQRQEIVGSLDRRVENREDDALTEATDDPVRDAFEHLRGPGQVVDEEDDMEEQIVWNPRANISPPVPPHIPLLPRTPPQNIPVPAYAPSSPMKLSPRSPTHGKVLPPLIVPSGPPPRAPSPVVPTTAQDLLKVINQPTKINRASLQPQPQAPLLFGSELASRPGASIWSAASDEQSLRFTGGQNGFTYASPPRAPIGLGVGPGFSGSLAQESAPPSWSSFHNNSQFAQQSPIGTLPSVPFALPSHHASFGGPVGHQRAPSASVSTQFLSGTSGNSVALPPTHHYNLTPSLNLNTNVNHSAQLPSPSQQRHEMLALGPTYPNLGIAGQSPTQYQPGQPHTRFPSASNQRRVFSQTIGSPIWGNHG